MRTFLIAALAAFLWMAAPQQEVRAQQLGGAHEFVWPEEFNGNVSCRRLIAARDTYLSRPRPRFNCIRGVDCPEDLTPAPPAPPLDFVLFYSWVDIERRPIDVNLPDTGFEIVRAAVERILEDMDRVARSRSKKIRVVGHADTAATGNLSQQISETIGECVGTAVNVGLHLNGYRGAYDFSIELVAQGEGALSHMTADSINEPLNRRATVTISY